MRYFFHIAYHGTHYSGWQRHPKVMTVQEVLETALSSIFKQPVAVNGCGRTDAGVHASQYFFYVDIEKEWEFDLFFRLNKVLPDDIAIFDIIPMQGLPHARFDATQRAYNYFIHTYKDPFLSGFSSLYLEPNLDLDKMKAATALLPLYNDYRCFCKMPDRNDNTICNVSSAEFFVDPKGDRLRFHISANRFLGKMVRIIMGRLLEIGTGKMSVDEFENYLIKKETPQIIIPAHPQGLYLSKVTYPYLDLPPRTSFLATLETDWTAV
ncbi:tRNA pseudouridine(38-40) synthase TruA [Mucilaginibacter sp. X4EP1]|uniref:tRNA pseudouridine(38-40) synthase TruA n=1 Tax=Mucilaginibacter sp. X4EP1 TaxID=2723092 RepID=UPI00216A9D9B|nr:tRNA pseudouridine(38-40) synthase TruA [Mucilaginibacter sp. X4EP1]MCS3812614.1 tRNA pseudouridine38-40 synthase [Mucilaginibacter sp. X4EP1]